MEVPKRKSKPIAATDILSDVTGADLTFPSISAAATTNDVVPSASAAKSVMPPPAAPAAGEVFTCSLFIFYCCLCYLDYVILKLILAKPI